MKLALLCVVVLYCGTTCDAKGAVKKLQKEVAKLAKLVEDLKENVEEDRHACKLPCDHGECADQGEQWVCVCEEGYTGFHCENGEEDIAVEQSLIERIYTILNRANEVYEVYCEFHDGYGYTYVSADTTVTVNVEDLFTTKGSVKLRHQRIHTDGSQYEATISQLSQYSSIPLSVQYNAYTGYASFKNKQMLPYLYLGILPVANATNHNIQGYSVNGQDQTFKNCDANPNSYFVFLFNNDNKPPTSYNVDNAFMRQWATLATLTAEDLPADYFCFMEMHMGGCGGYTTTNLIPNVVGVALGMRFDAGEPDL